MAARRSLPLFTISKLAAPYFKGVRGSHDLDHTARVVALARYIAKKEKADPVVVECAAWLHDIARAREDRSHGALCHAAVGAKAAEKILANAGCELGFRTQVSHCIAAHRFRGTVKPATVEARVLFDADKLDSIGAVGIGRAFLFAGEVGARLHDPKVDIKKTKPYSIDDTAYREYLVKLRYVQGRLLTATGTALARERHRFMTAFFIRLNREVAGHR